MAGLAEGNVWMRVIEASLHLHLDGSNQTARLDFAPDLGCLSISSGSGMTRGSTEASSGSILAGAFAFISAAGVSFAGASFSGASGGASPTPGAHQAMAEHQSSMAISATVTSPFCESQTRDVCARSKKYSAVLSPPPIRRASFAQASNRQWRSMLVFNLPMVKLAAGSGARVVVREGLAVFQFAKLAQNAFVGHAGEFELLVQHI